MELIFLKSVGADPEVFFARKGIPVSAEGLVGGTKEKPIPMAGLPMGYFVQEDNVSAEYNIPPATSPEEFARSVQLGLKYLKSVAKNHRLGISLLPDADFTPAEVGTPHAQRLGCDPDYNAWEMALNPRPNPPELMRTAAGHVHVGWENPDKEQITILIRALDLYLGVPSILCTPKNRRRQLYGKAGAFRPKTYGAEYRVLDNFWLANSKYSSHIFRAVKSCVIWLNSDPRAPDKLQYASQEIQAAINEHDKELAKLLLSDFQVSTFPNLIPKQSAPATTAEIIIDF